MKPTLLCAVLALTGALSLPSAQAEMLFQFTVAKDYVQTGIATADFRGGQFNVNVRDGNVVMGNCPLAPSPVLLFPDPMFCPDGTPGYIAFGGDGGTRFGAFYPVMGVMPAATIEPFRPELIQLVSGPASTLARPINAFADVGMLVFWDLFTPVVREYDLTWYDYNRLYPAGGGGLSRMRTDFVTGVYTFQIPLLNPIRFGPPQPIRTAQLNVAYHQAPEGPDLSDPRHKLKTPFLFTGGKWVAGERLLDPYLTNRITWQGNDVTNAHPGVDQFYLAIYSLADLPEAPGEPPAGAIPVFPPSGTPILLPTPLDTHYNLPPFFFAPGDQVWAQLRFSRAWGTNPSVYDSAQRVFHMPIRFMQTYASFAMMEFPPDTSAADRAADRDFDGDGLTNIQEFVLGTDPASAADPGSPAIADLPEIAGGLGHQFQFLKAPGIYVEYGINVTLGGTTVRVSKNKVPAGWKIDVDDDLEFTISTAKPGYTARIAPKALTLQ